MLRPLVAALALLLASPAVALDVPTGPALRSGQLPFSAPAIEASKHLGMSPAFVDGVVEGLNLLYQRRYKDCRAWFADLAEAFPHTGVAPVGDVLVWQSIMLENFDFRYDDQYRAASALARQQFSAAAKVKGGETWEELMLTVISGLEGIHAARQGHYLPALTLAFEAVDHIEKTRKLAPDFVDLHLADGLYNFWRTVVTERTKGMPDFGDKKAEGLAQMQDVVDHGVFLVAPAHLSLAFAWLDQRDNGKAIAELLVNQQAYPENVINELMLGMARLYGRDPRGAMVSFDRVLELDPTNRRAHYYKGVAQLRLGQPALAEAELRTYLAFDHLEAYQVSAAWFRLGDAIYQQKRYADAYAAYEAAVKADGDSGAKAAIERMKRERKEGKITW